jgi:hypothetical protein
VLTVCFGILGPFALRAFIAPARAEEEPAALSWMTDYAAARREAADQRKMLLNYFRNSVDNAARREFEQTTLQDVGIRQSLGGYVLLRMAADSIVETEQEPVELLKHHSFQAMNGRPGLAIVDFKHVDAPHFKHAVGCLPFEPPVYFASPYHGVKSVAAFLDLPAGTLTQRMMVYAVRMHPESPSSTSGLAHPVLLSACERHSQHQARIRLQGHHNWSSRFHEIWRQVPGEPLREVCAESWPDHSLLAACLDCVHSWRQSSGHWSAVRGAHPAFGYDIRMGSNGIWYATGMFGGKRDDRR